MQRIIWVGGVAWIAHAGCIEDRTPSPDPEPIAPDTTPQPQEREPSEPVQIEPVEPEPEAAQPEPAPVEPEAEAVQPEPIEPEPIEPEPVQPEPTEPPEPEPLDPEPDPDLPPWVCQPEGQHIYLGACVGADLSLPDFGRYDAQIVAIGDGLPDAGLCSRGHAPHLLGNPGSDRMRWIRAIASDGQTWQVVLDLPVDVRFVVGEAILIETALQEGWTYGVAGTLSISTAQGLQALIQADLPDVPRLDHPELHLGRGRQSCEYSDGPGANCTYAGYRLRAADPHNDVVHELRVGQRADVGPFQVINGGILSVGSNGFCNFPPEDFSVGVWRRR